MKSVKENYLYVKAINYGGDIINSIHPSKALDASEMKDFIESKRYTMFYT